MARNTLSRSMHDLGLSAWFGGTLANPVYLNKASSEASTAPATGAVANTGWDRWAPVNAAAIGIHVVGSLGQIAGNKGRLSGQQGVASMAAAKTAPHCGGPRRHGVQPVPREEGLQAQQRPCSGRDNPRGRDPRGCRQGAGAAARAAVGRARAHRRAGCRRAFAGEQQRASEASEGILDRVTPGR